MMTALVILAAVVGIVVLLGVLGWLLGSEFWLLGLLSGTAGYLVEGVLALVGVIAQAIADALKGN